MDLVTEGIITLSKTLEALKAEEGKNKRFEQKNAVALLSKMFMESDNIRFLVGKAINPAHQNRIYP